MLNDVGSIWLGLFYSDLNQKHVNPLSKKNGLGKVESTLLILNTGNLSVTFKWITSISLLSDFQVEQFFLLHILQNTL